MNNKLAQVIYDMRHQPVIGWVTIIGTALSIFLIITVVMMQQIQVMPFAPESNRDRMLYGIYFHKRSIENTGNLDSSGGLSHKRAEQLYDGLDGAERMSLFRPYISAEDVTGTRGETFMAKVRYADAAFWDIFDHKLLYGRYFTEDEVKSGTHVAVLSEGTARRLFGTDNPVGQTYEHAHRPFLVVGVVANSSVLATQAHGEVFLPLPTDDWDDGEWGDVAAAILVKKGIDFSHIRDQVRRRYAEMDTELASENYTTVYHEAPFDQETMTCLRGSNNTPDVSDSRQMRYAIYAILLLVPAINLSSMLHSRLRRRVSEIGIRRAFGCTRSRIILDIIAENFMVTLVGGIIGLALGVLFGLFYDGLYNAPDGVAARPALSMLLNTGSIAAALAACFILNIISAAVPAWQASRVRPVEAINNKH